MWWWSLLVAFFVGVFLLVQALVSDRSRALQLIPKLPADLTIASLHLRFPATFLWGAATAAHQVEGNQKNQWTEFEKTVKPDGKPATNGQSGRACDHWERFEQDLDRIESLGLNCYRFSVEWSRIEPEKGKFDESAIQRYRRWCILLNQRNIKPMVTLHHFSDPIWFAELGSFETNECIAHFGRFTNYVLDHLGDVCTDWCTINEPVVYSFFGWVTTEFPPAKDSLPLCLAVTENLLLCHAVAYHAIKRRFPQSQVGLVQNIVLFQAKRWWNPLDMIVARILDSTYNWACLDAASTGELILGPHLPLLPKYKRHHAMLANTLDFVGINHYFRYQAMFDWKEPLKFRLDYDPKCTKTDMGWDLLPSSLFGAVMSAARYHLPIIVTEHGTADGETPDTRRQDMILGGLWALQKARELGADVRGYIHWSLLDNFEWAQGFKPRFGLFRMNYDTQERTETGGATLLKNVIKRWRATV